MNDITPRELEVEALRENDGLTYKAIGEYLGVSPTMARHLYVHAKRKRRDALRRELSHGETECPVNVPFLPSELTALQDLLKHVVQTRRHKGKTPSACYTDRDYAAARLLYNKLTGKD